MRATLLVLLSFLAFYSSFAQSPAYQEKMIIGSTPAMNIQSMTLDQENNLYLTDMSRVVKTKDGEILLDFRVNIDDYNAGYDNKEGVYLDIAVDQEQFIYILNRKKKRIEKHDQHGKLIKIFDPAGDLYKDLSRSLSLHMDHSDNINLFDEYNRRIFVYNSDGILIEIIILENPNSVWGSDNITIAFDKQNNIYAAETKTSSWDPRAYVSLFNREGKIIQRFSDALMKESDFNKPYWLYIDADKNGDLYVYNFRSPVSVFSPTGSLKKRFTTSSGRGSHIRFDNQNNMYVGIASEKGDHILKYDQEQQFIERIGNLRRPYEVAFDKSDNFYILDHIKRELVKYNSAGEEDLVFRSKVSDLMNPLTFTIDDKGYIYVLEYGGFSSSSSRISKFDANGKRIGLSTDIRGSYDGSQYNYVSAGLAVDHEGHIYVTYFNSSDTHSLLKIDPQGKKVGKIGPNGKEPGQLSKPLDVTVDAAGNVYVLDMNGKRVQKFSSNGKFIQQYGSFDPNEESFTIRASIASDAFGNVLVATPTGTHLGIKGPDVKYYDITGRLVFSLPINTSSVAMSRSGSLIATTDQFFDKVTVYETASTREYNLIEGNIYHDANANCIQDEVETGLADILVKAEPGPYYGATDKSGNFRFFVGKGNYTVSPITENSSGKMISQPCTSGGGAASINFADYGNYSTGNDAGVQVTLSPYLTASVSSTRRRRCFESTTKLTYSNTGFAPAQNAKVYLQLPEQVELLSANKPFTRLPDGTYVFEAGTVAPGQTSVITVQDKVVCGDESIRGLTVCTKAWITPSNQPPTAPPTAVSAVTGKCDAATGYVRFVIRNNGQADMGTGEQFRVYQDGKLATIENYQLATGDSMVLRVPAMGRTVRLEADQPDGNGDNTLASATVEACRAGGSPVAFSTGLVNAMPADDEEAEVAEECLPIIDSFDPNDKAVFPTGVTTENFTPTSTALHYKIRFQNTGTDLAYRVVVVDTLSEHLDISTLQLGSASHNYTYAVSGKGRPVLTWTLDNIMLPDSTTNEPGSHGYIQFSIKPKADLPEKTTIENLADIFFDFNSPVRTNVTVNRIYDVPREVLAENRITSEEIIMTPVIQAFSPAAGKPGAEVLITGTKFSEDAHRNKVYINGVQAEIVEGTATILKVRVPESARTGTLSVVTEHAGVSSKAAFVVYQPPVVSGFSPTEGVVGAEVTLHGSYLAEGVLESVKIGELICEVISATPEALVLRVPEGASSGKFQVLTMGGEAESAAPYIVWHQPQISSLSKRTDRVGSELFIYGDNFSTVASRNIVTIGQVPAGVLQASATSLKVRVPQGAASGYITVETPGGAALSAMAFEVIPAPVLLSVSPVRGSVGSVVELKGEHFSVLGQQDTVLFNGLKALVLHAGETSLTVRVPRGAQTGKVQVTGIGGSTLSATDFVVEEQTPHQAIAVYPNPTTGRFTIDFMKADFDVLQVEIFNTIGALVLYQAVDQENALEIDLTAPGAGLYHIRVSTSRGKVSKRLSVL